MSKREFDQLRDFIEKTKGVGHSLIGQFGVGWGSHRKSLHRSLRAQDIFELAIDRLRVIFYFFGIAEYFEESIFAFAKLCGLTSVAPWVRDNRNPAGLWRARLVMTSVIVFLKSFAMIFCCINGR